jgi:hypothetical protein
MGKLIRLALCTAVVLSLLAGQCFAAAEKTIKLDEDWRLTGELDINAGDGSSIIIDGQGRYTIYEMTSAAILKNTTGTVRLKNVRVINIAAAPAPGSLAALSQAAAAVTVVAAPAKDATSLILPVVTGFTVSIESSSNTGVIAVNGAITPPTAPTAVNLVLKLAYTGNTTGEAYINGISVIVPAKSGSGGGDTGGNPAPASPPALAALPATPAITVTDTGTGSSASTHVSAALSTVAGTGGNAVATVSQAVADGIIKAAKDAAASGRNATLEFSVESGRAVSGVSVNIPRQTFSSIAASPISDMKITTEVAEITFDKAAVSAINGGTGDVSISAARLDNAALSAEAKAIVGDRPVFDFSVTSGTERITNFNGGSVTISIPYILKPGEDAGAILIYYMDADGKAQAVKASSYDAATGRVTFTTAHFSKYAVGYRAVKFTDISKHWAREHIAYLAARSIITQESDKFAPNANITRAELVKLISSAVDGIDVTKAKAASFTDVSAGQLYTPYINWAAEKGIVTGIGGGKFGAGNSITRQDMATIIYRFTQKMAIKLPSLNDRIAFDDDGKIAPYAKNGVYVLQRAGIISGGGGNMFNPAGTATRAEAAKIIAGIVQGMAR